MESLRKWFYRPKKDDTSLLAQFFFADEALNLIAGELDSFDGRKDPERCTTLVNQLRQSQDKVLTIANGIMDVLIGDQRTNRDFRAKFPEDVLQENLAGQLWFGAECLAAGSSIMNREEESTAMRPLARALTKRLEHVRNLLRDACLRSNTPNAPLKLNNNELINEVLIENLKIFDRLFAEFELCYVSAMVPVKSPHEYEMQQVIGVLFSETLQRALKMKLLTQEMIDDCDPALMFTIPRLAIVNGLLSFPNGPLCIDKPEEKMSEMFGPFRTVLHKIRELLWTLNKKELYMLEKLLCDNEQISDLKSVSDLSMYNDFDDFINQFYNDYPLCRDYLSNFYNINDSSVEMVSAPNSCQSTKCILKNSHIPSTSKLNTTSAEPGTSQSLQSSPECDSLEVISGAVATLSSILATDTNSNEKPESGNNNDDGSLNDSGVCTENTSLDRSPTLDPHDTTTCKYLKSSTMQNCQCEHRSNKKPVFQGQIDFSPGSSKNISKLNKKRHRLSNTCVPETDDTVSISSSDTSSFNSNCADDEEIALALQAAEIAGRNEVRAKFKSPADLLHRLFVCIAGVADQLQTNFASDLRNILKSVFLMNISDTSQTPSLPPESNLDASIEYHPTPSEVTENDEFTVDPNILAQEALFDNYVYFHINENDESNSVYSNRPRSQEDLNIPDLSENFGQLVNVGETLRQAVTNNIVEEHHIARESTECEQPPLWIPDIEASKCMGCGVPFTVVKRRHHCRNCGKIFCGRCSSNTAPLPKFGHIKPVRVCKKCFMCHIMPFTT